MQQRPRIEQLWHRHLEPAKWPLWAALTPLAGFYRAALLLRSCLRSDFDRAPLPVISVGNLTVGGNAKTPFTLYLAKLLQAKGYKVGIVSRGYGRSQRAPRLVAENGKRLLGVTESGDEPAMMAYHFDGPIAVASRRSEAIRLLTERGPLDAIILDDGFQHRRLHRDLDLVVVAAHHGFGNAWLLPAGPLREPLEALGRADAVIVISSSVQDNEAFSSRQHQALAQRPLLHACVRPRALVRAATTGWIESNLDLRGRRIVAVSGLADPASFAMTLARLGAVIVSSFAFPDHHNYSAQDWAEITAAAKRAEGIITTEKDLVKLQTFSLGDSSMYALRLGISMRAEAEAQLLEMVLDSLRSFGQNGERPHRAVSVPD